LATRYWYEAGQKWSSPGSAQRFYSVQNVDRNRAYATENGPEAAIFFTGGIFFVLVSILRVHELQLSAILIKGRARERYFSQCLQ
jgi:hypothetical protein